MLRDAAVWADGRPLFTSLQTNYGFADGRFHIEGEYEAADGQLQPGFVQLAFAVQRGSLQVAIVEHNIAGLDDELERINAALSAELMAKIAGSLGQEVLAYRDVEPIAGSILQVSLTTALDPDQMVVPLPSQ